MLLVVVVTVASADDGTIAPKVLTRLTAEHRSRLELLWADGKYHNHHLNGWLVETETGERIAGVSRPPGSKYNAAEIGFRIDRGMRSWRS